MSRSRKSASIAAAIGFGGLAGGLLIDPTTVFASYLVAWIVISAIPVGALAVLFTAYLVRAGWTHDLHDLLARTALTMPVVAVLFIPIVVGMEHLYPWASNEVHLTGFKAAYLTPWFFILRSVSYFTIWTALAFWGARAYGNDIAMKRIASAGLIVWALTLSWAGIDWLESLEPQFHSSIYGLLMIGFHLLTGLSFAIAALVLLRRTRQMGNAAYAGTLLSVLLLWAYLHSMQYIIIWTGNIPDEVKWYLERLKGGWGVALWALFIFQFFVPFFALLSESVRGSTKTLLWLAVATLALRYLEAGVLILPPLKIVPTALWLDLPAAMVATGAVWLLTWLAAKEVWRAAFSRYAAATR